MDQTIHGKIGLRKIPVGGRQIMFLEFDRIIVKLFSGERLIGVLRGARSQTFLAKGHWRNRCSAVYSSPQWTQQALSGSPLLKRLSPRGRALCTIFHMKTFILGENLPDQMSEIQLIGSGGLVGLSSFAFREV
ncbi:unnamed protein product [Microthlaspi erraticum]|uniref:Uncharacterized protein n=1 Tax=Microthlaspi erraticum TaxID=1685480 RepID=A0A6D2HZB1_9BRAS|nr:unnamed protein product [Microthlaspi erraticum]